MQRLSNCETEPRAVAVHLDTSNSPTWRAMRVAVTPALHRQYFHAIYFRGPCGVNFAIATDGPGFATDVRNQKSGEMVSLPPWLEPKRTMIERRLRHKDSAPAKAPEAPNNHSERRIRVLVPIRMMPACTSVEAQRSHSRPAHPEIAGQRSVCD